MGFNFLGESTFFGGQQFLGANIFWGSTVMGFTKMLGSNFLGVNICWGQTFLVVHIFGRVKHFEGKNLFAVHQEFLGFNNFWRSNIVGGANFWGSRKCCDFADNYAKNGVRTAQSQTRGRGPQSAPAEISNLELRIRICNVELEF